ncbi:MAG: transposase [Peptococcaceae bacterium]|nr:transposase [Peptococcaceae bacterium]
MAVVYTFGGALGFNPHIHALVTEGALDRFNQWKPVSFIPYEYLRKKWQWMLLKIIREKFKNDPRKLELVKWLYSRYPNGFYVHAKNRMKNARGAARYIGRYLARPAIAEYRIISYDGKTVRFWYIDHNTEKRAEAELDVLEFIGRLTMHIPKKHFRMVRRYGLYRRGKNDMAQKAVDSYNATKLGIAPPRRRSIKRRKGSWRSRMINSFGKDPLKCPFCGHEMELWYIWHRRYGYMYHFLGSDKWRKPYEEKEKESTMARRV